MTSGPSLRSVRVAIALGIGGVAFIPIATMLTGCGDHESSAIPDSDEGQASIVALALSASDLKSVTVTITGPNGGTLKSPLVVNLQRQGGHWSGLASRIPVGSGYNFALVALDANNAVAYSGNATGVTIAKDRVTEVIINAQQANPPTPFSNAAPVLDWVVASTTRLAPGEAIALSAHAHDPDSDASPSYRWMASRGNFSAPSGSTTDWVAPNVAGTYPLTLTVTDQSGAAVSVQIQVVVEASAAMGSANVNATLNTWPVVAQIAGSPNYVVKGGKTLLTAVATDSDGDTLLYSWTSSCAGSLSNTQGPTPSFDLDSAEASSSCSFSVTVNDTRGGVTTGSLLLPVGAPSVVVAPAIAQATQSATEVEAKDRILFTVRAADPKSLPLSFTWAATGGTLTDQTNDSGASQISWSPPADAASSWSVTATATNSLGQATSYAFKVQPASCFAAPPPKPSSWSFGVMSDTQWTTADDGKNPNTVAVDITNQLNAQFIAKGVKFVVAAGDLTDNGSVAALDTRVQFAQALYEAGIGFFPLRGNHESSKTAAAEFLRVFPQTRNGQQNATPRDAFIAHWDDVNTLPSEPKGLPFAVGSNFTSPSPALAGLSYAFDYENARVLLLDQFTPADGSANSIAAQQDWINTTLSVRSAGSHGFVFAHKPLIAENHADTLFGNDPSKNPTGQDAFITSLAKNGVRYLISGHDHLHNRALVATTDGTSASVQDIILASDSSKFYQPAATAIDVKYNVPAFDLTRETPLAQELNTVGYYIVTITDQRANVDFYSAAANPNSGSLQTTPILNFTKRESFGYGLNGKEFVIAPQASYASVRDSFGTTTVEILAGSNLSSEVDGNGRRFSKIVGTAWSSPTCATASAILNLWVTGALGTGQTDTYALSLSYDPSVANTALINRGALGIATKDANGDWVNAVDKNFAGTKRFVLGPYQRGAELGTYGVDLATHTAWAVLNHSSEFAVAAFPGGEAVTSGKP